MTKIKTTIPYTNIDWSIRSEDEALSYLPTKDYQTVCDWNMKNVNSPDIIEEGVGFKNYDSVYKFILQSWGEIPTDFKDVLCEYFDGLHQFMYWFKLVSENFYDEIEFGDGIHMYHRNDVIWVGV